MLLYISHAKTKKFKSRLEATMTSIQKLPHKNIGVSFSGGKDSTVMLHLLRQFKNVKVFFYDSGAELPDTYEIIQKYNPVEVVKPEMSIIDIHKYNGNFGAQRPQHAEKDLFYTNEQFKEILITEPSDRMIKKYDLDLICIGLRREESKSRSYMLRNGKLQRFSYSLCDQFYPLADWTVEDIWAYIISKNIPYNKSYNNNLYQNKNEQRIGTYMGTTGISRGRMQYIKSYYPEIFNKLLLDFPLLSTYT